MKKLLAPLAFAVLFASTISAQIQIPDTPAGRQFSAWIAAFNSGDRAVMQQFFDKSMKFGRLDQDMAIRAQTGGFDVRKVEESGPNRIVVLAQERGPAHQFTRIAMSVAPDEPHDVAGLRFQNTEPPAELAPPKLTAAEIEAARKDVPFQQFSAWLDAFNSGDRARIGQYLEANYPQRKLDAELSFRNRVNGFEFRTIERATPTSVTGLVQERDSDQFARFNLQVEPDQPHKIMRFSLLVVPRPAEFPIPRMSEADLVTALRAKLDRDAVAGRFAGSVLLAKNGKILFSGAWGLADREKNLPNTLDTRFRIGSMNKMFTATSVIQLVQAGKTKLTDSLGKYITDYPNQDIATKVTIHQLLTHTGGTGDFFGPEFNAHRLELKTLNDYVNLFGKRGPGFEPGSQWAYSNYGMILLGVVIERVTGQTYYSYVAEHVYKPAGMTRTGSEPESETVPGRAVGYMRSQSGAWTPNTDTLPYRGTSAGGGYSTVADLQKFADALMAHKLLTPENTDLLITGKVDSGGGSKYAYGFEDGRKDGAGAVGHSGGAPGMNGDLRIFTRSGYVVAALSNLDPAAATQVSEFIGLRLPQ
jgi:CubicO group peptidase (beta-lactamase class C family)